MRHECLDHVLVLSERHLHRIPTRYLTYYHCARTHLALENLALRHQLAVYKRPLPRPRLRKTDRLFWIWLARVCAGWRQPLVIVPRHRPPVLGTA